MVGLKSVWITISALFLLAACVPQTKQTACGENEAFNSSLRKCVPTTKDPASYITISSFSPTTTFSRYKLDFNPMSFRVDISNPYDQDYTVRWTRTFNGQTTNITNIVESPTQWTIYPTYFQSEIGLHVVTVDVLDNKDKIVASHGFQFTINNSPSPYIRNTAATTAQTETVINPLSGVQNFSIATANNGATIPSTSTYRVTWRLLKYNVEIAVQNNNFSNITPTGTNTAAFAFNPAGVGLGVGSYVLRGRLIHDPTNETIDERQYPITVKVPDFGYVSAATLPIVSQDTIAFHGTDYSTFGFRNTSNVKSDFCITVSDADGTYTNGTAADPTNLDMVVRFYKDGAGSPIYEGTTNGSSTPIDDTVCFSDANLSEQAGLFFSDGSPTLPHYRTLTARVFDEQTGTEVCSPGLPTCPSTYPISWKVLVKPLNQGVTATFVSSIGADNIAYTSTGPTSRSADIVQGRTVRLRFIPTDGVANLEGYSMTGLDTGDNFKYSVVIKQGSTTIDTQVCKDFTTEFSRVGSTTTQLCDFTWPSFNPITGAHLPTGTYQAYLQVEDTGSPVPGSTGIISTALTISATVTANTTAPVIGTINILDGTNTVITTAPEGTPITFSVPVSDAEHDTYTLKVEYCATDSSCTSPAPSLVSTDTRVYGDPLYSLNLSIATSVPEDILGASATGTIYYRVTATDSTGNTSNTTRSLPLTNFNAPPSINTGLVTPAVAGTYEVMAGNQFTGRLNTAISDASTSTAERTTTFQWWIGTANDLNDPTGWTAIADATTNTLNWSPGSELSGPRYIAVCYSDGYPRLTANSTNAPDLDGNPTQRCTYMWTVTPRTNSMQMSGTASIKSEVAVFDVPAENVSYIAFADGDLINVEKVERRSTGTALNKPMGRVSFNALTTGSAATVKNISLTASDTSLYVSYLADSATTPNSFRAHIRRFNISKLNANGGEKLNAAFAGSDGMKRKFGFNYSGYSVVANCAGSVTNCAWDATTKIMTFDGTSLTAGSTIEVRQTVNGVTTSASIPVSTDPYTAGTVCSNCSNTVQAQSFAEALNLSASAVIQGITATSNGVNGETALFGMEFGTTEVFSSSQTMTAMGKILYNSDDGRWTLPVANADLMGAQNKIQLLSGPDGNISAASMLTTNTLTGLPTVSAIDNAWSGDAPKAMFLGYVRLAGSLGFVTKLTVSGGVFTPGPSIGVIPSSGIQSIQVAGPIGTENPYVYVSAIDNSDRFWVSRINSILTVQNSFRIAPYGQDAADTVLLTDANVSQIHVEPAKALSPATTSGEARLVVVSNNGGSSFQSYLFRWRIVGSAPVIDATTTFDRDSIETDLTSKIAAFAPSMFTFGNNGATAGENTNATMGVVRALDNGTVEFNILNSESESINSTTNSPTGAYRAPYVK